MFLWRDDDRVAYRGADVRLPIIEEGRLIQAVTLDEDGSEIVIYESKANDVVVGWLDTEART